MFRNFVAATAALSALFAGSARSTGQYPFTPAPAEPRQRRADRPAKSRLRAGFIMHLDQYAVAINGLTNWQRNQWARAGYPGARQRDAATVRNFAHRKSIERFHRRIERILA